jgi:hypothetical protein
MKYLFLYIIITLSCNSIKADEISESKGISDTYRSLSKAFKSECKFSLQDTLWFQASQLIPTTAMPELNKVCNREEDSKDSITNQSFPWNIYSPRPSTWDQWRKVNEENDSDSIQTIDDFSLKNRIRALQAKSISSEMQNESIRSVVRNTLSEWVCRPDRMVFAPLENFSVVVGGVVGRYLGYQAPSGSLRESGRNSWPNGCKNGGMREHIGDPAYFSIPGKIDQKYNVCCCGGRPPLKCQEDGDHFCYIEGKDVEKELDHLEGFIKEKLKGFTSESAEKDKIEFLATVQRAIAVIHPVSKGVGRTSRFIQNSLAQYLGLPPVPAGLLQADVSKTYAQYAKDTFSAYGAMITQMEKCKEECTSEGGIVSRACLPLSTRNDSIPVSDNCSALKSKLTSHHLQPVPQTQNTNNLR